MDKVKAQRKIVSIQILRAIACLLVLQVHLFSIIPVIKLRFNGGIGVDLFFIISGYIIAASLEKATGNNGIKAFFINRISRVAPYYYLMTVLTAVVIFTTAGVFDVGRFVNSLVFWPQASDPTLVPGWSLNHEMFFYLFSGLSLLFLKNLKHIAVFFFLIILAARFIPANTYPVNFLRAGVNFTFLLGFLCYVYRKLVFKYFRFPILIIVFAILLLIVAAVSSEVPFNKAQFSLVPEFGFYPRDIVFLVDKMYTVPRIIIYGLPALLFFMSCVANEHLFLRLDHTWFMKIGDASYSLYLLQGPLIVLIKRYELFNTFYLALFFIAVILLSLQFHKLENYIGNATKKLFVRVVK